MPPDSVMILLSLRSHSDSDRSTFSTKAGFGALPNRPRLNETAFHTVSKTSVVSSCGTRPIIARTRR